MVLLVALMLLASGSMAEEQVVVFDEGLPEIDFVGQGGEQADALDDVDLSELEVDDSEDYRYFVEIIAKTKTWLLYNYQDIVQIQFYFDAEDNISLVALYDVIQVIADKETTRTIQEYLNENGYDCGMPDGIAGNATKAALKRFQEDHDLYPSGYIDDCLMKYLNAQNG